MRDVEAITEKIAEIVAAELTEEKLAAIYFSGKDRNKLYWNAAAIGIEKYLQEFESIGTADIKKEEMVELKVQSRVSELLPAFTERMIANYLSIAPFSVQQLQELNDKGLEVTQSKSFGVVPVAIYVFQLLYQQVDCGSIQSVLNSKEHIKGLDLICDVPQKSEARRDLRYDKK